MGRGRVIIVIGAAVVLVGIAIAGYVIWDSPAKVETLQGTVAVVRGELPKHGMLGIAFVANSSPPTVESVTPGSGAATAGIRSGDVILSVGTVQQPDKAAIRKAVEPTSPGDVMPVVIRRDGTEIKLDVKLISMQDIIAAKSSPPPATVP